MTRPDLVLRGVSVMGAAPTDMAIADGMIVRIGHGIGPGEREYDAHGLTALPGLIDHHIHLLATAARMASCDLSGLYDPAEIAAKLRDFAATRPAGEPVRATGLDCIDGPPDRETLSQWLPDRPLRIQDRTGALWLLNDAMLAQLGTQDLPDCVERDPQDNPTGRIWRGDAWLRERLGGDVPDLVGLHRQLVSFGITGVTDTGPANGPDEAALFERLIADGTWRLRLQLMGREDLPQSALYSRGPLKLHYDERDLPPLDEVVERIGSARQQGRNVAAHCVSEGELAWYIAALDASGGARMGDRVEHGSLVSDSMAGEVAARRLAVVSQPAFIHAHGVRYRRNMDAAELDILYRLAGLQRGHGIALAAGSDAPYGPLDPWLAMRAAIDRRAADGSRIGPDEGLTPADALDLFLRPFDVAQPSRELKPGNAADIIMMQGTMADILADPSADRVRYTLVGGEAVHESE